MLQVQLYVFEPNSFTTELTQIEAKSVRILRIPPLALSSRPQHVVLSYGSIGQKYLARFVSRYLNAATFTLLIRKSMLLW